MVFEETFETTRQALVNTALRIDNKLRQTDMTANLENHTFVADKEFISRMLKGNTNVLTLNQYLPNAYFYVTDNGDSKDVEDSYVFSEPIYNGKFELVIVCPKNDIYSKFKAGLVFQLFIGVFGLLLINLFCWKVIVRHLLPLHQLADSAELIASGNLEELVPDSGMKNEIGQLQNSFATMQLSLANYIDEMRQKQVLLSRQNIELENAYNQAQEYEKLKTRFLNNMTDQVLKPINSICQLTEQTCENYHSIKESDMALIQKKIKANTEIVTHLLEQLLNVPNQKNSNKDQ